MIGKKISSMALIPIVVIALCFADLTACAQQKTDDYTTAWKAIDSLIDKKGLPQSAVTRIEKLYARAKKERNDAQLIRALLYHTKLTIIREEDAALKNITFLEKEKDSLREEPAKSILTNILAGAYWDYFQQNRYRFYNRTTIGHEISVGTNTPGPKKKTQEKTTDITTWGPSDFFKKIGALFLASLHDKKLLQETDLSHYDPIVIKGNSRNLRPTLFDLLAHRALDYFESNESDVIHPSYAFEIDDKSAFSEKELFSSHRFVTNDSASLHFTALRLLQELTRMHLKDLDPAALIDLDIERLNFANRYAVMEEKDSLYVHALAHITDLYPNEPAAAQAWYLQANALADKAADYDPVGDTSHRYDYLPAEIICKRVIQQKDSSEGKTLCQALLASIAQTQLSIETEKVNVPGQPFRSLLSWKNSPMAYFRVIRIDEERKETLYKVQHSETFWEKLLEYPALKEFSQSLPATGDHQQHRVEIKNDGLPVGEYALLASASGNFSFSGSPITVQFIHISDIAYISMKNDFFVLNRSSGQPLAGATVQVWNRIHDYQTGRPDFVKSSVYHTDEHGHFLLKQTQQTVHNAQLLEITAGSDHLFPDEQVPVFLSADEINTPGKKEYNQTFFFTDRALYRPGQTVFFKGIVVARDLEAGQSQLQKNHHTKLYLYDANGEKVDSMAVQTNEFGSYQGRFLLPDGRLNGQFRLEDDSSTGSISFSVEEYKRPKFHVDYETVKGTYRVYDTLRIQGHAKSYTGATVGGSVVNYRVVRETTYAQPFLFHFFPYNKPAEIAHGVTETRSDGSFTITFSAIPDKKINPLAGPVFRYKVTADITDIDGETRTGETTVTAGYKALQLSVKMPADPGQSEFLQSDSLKTIKLFTNNNSGIFEPAMVKVTAFLLKSPDRLIRERYWKEPDQFVISKDEYLGYFPHDEYKDELKKEHWERLEKVLEKTDSSRTNGEFPLGNKKFKAGWYAFEVRTRDKYGVEIKDTKYIELYEGNTYHPVSPRYDWMPEKTQFALPGDHADLTMGSSAKKIFVIRNIEKQKKNRYDFVTVPYDEKDPGISIDESDRGGFGVLHAFIVDNRYYTGVHGIFVPWSDKYLSIEYSSYRDKTLPGSGEKWQLGIRGNNGEKVSAEVLTGMYDASLDGFTKQEWTLPELWHTYSSRNQWAGESDFGETVSQQKYSQEKHSPPYFKKYDQILQAGSETGFSRRFQFRTMPALASTMLSGDRAFEKSPLPAPSGRVSAFENAGDAFIPGRKIITITDSVEEEVREQDQDRLPVPTAVQLRKNFNETAFFFPDLRTDSAGNVSFSFTMPEALTSWKWMTLAHTKDLAFGYSEKTIVTQKQLMVQPNAPRFLREGDRIELSAKIVNLTDSEMTGQVELQLIDATTNQSVDGWFINRQANQYFTIAAGQSTAVNFPLEIPYQFNRPVTYRIVARSKSYSDGEENMLPVVSNRVLVTETLPLNIRGTGTRGFRFEKLLQSGSSETLNHHALTVEFSSNPAWYAVQALPYLIEYPYECAEQTFERYYANALAASIVKNAPRIQQVFAGWQTKDTAALLSNLEKNPELKSALLEETPWVLEAKSESQQKKNISLLFNITRMTRELGSALNKLQQMQSENGGFVWFKGGRDDRYITQTILTGIGHLKKLGAIPVADTGKINEIVRAGMDYLDERMIDDYGRVKKEADDIQIQYLYLRSLFKDLDIPGPVFPAMNFYRKQTQQHWLEQNRYMQGMIALSLFRTGDIRTAREILKSLKQNALTSEEMGMYWKDMQGGYYWYQAPIETQSLLIEAFREITHDTAIDQGLKTWLLKQKQTQSWSTTKATADACYALLLGGSDWLAADRKVEIHLGDQTIVSDPSARDSGSPDGLSSAEAGTGYFKKVFPGASVRPDMGKISVTIGSSSGKVAAGNASPIAWGSVYWQYFENSDKITPAETLPLKLTKSLFLTRNTDRGPVLEPVQANAELKVGDKVTVRIELKADRDMEYVHMKDMRASCMEPTNVLSEYKWQDGLGYYETTKDASTNFFFDRIPRGSYVFEYTLFISQAGNFSNGITTIQCMYAPEFSSHSEGSRISVAGE